jgi:AMP nucleosidase
MKEREVSEEQFARDTLERYSGTPAEAFQSKLIITNFPQYVKYFAKSRGVSVHEGSMFTVAHAPEEDISILDFKIGSTAAALVVDLCSFLPIQSAVLLGMCAGLRRRYEVGDYLVPTASIRCEGTSDFYFPPEVPALGNFLMQRAIARVLDEESIPYHVGITFTTNLRFWEFNEGFIERLKATRAQALELECATLFMASYKRKFTLGALLLVSDLPLDRTKVKTKKSASHVFDTYMSQHVELGVDVLRRAHEMQSRNIKGSYK